MNINIHYDIYIFTFIFSECDNNDRGKDTESYININKLSQDVRLHGK